MIAHVSQSCPYGQSSEVVSTRGGLLEHTVTEHPSKKISVAAAVVVASENSNPKNLVFQVLMEQSKL